MAVRGLSLKWKLAVLFFGVVAVAFGVIYFILVPQLESNLRDQKLRDLRRSATSSSRVLEEVMGRELPAAQLDRLVRTVADGAGAQVTLLGIQRSAAGGRDLRFYVISDSRAGGQVPRDKSLADRAVRTRRIQTTSTGFRGGQVGLAAQPLYYRGRADWIAVYSLNLDDVAESVSLVRSRVLAAGSIALLVALFGGYLVAQALARRVRRLEVAAQSVAAGQPVDPLPVDSDDELGQLTQAFNEMQEQLARVDRARKDFIANASHELRTPIFSLGGFVELLEDEELDEKTREEFLVAMREQVERLQKLAVDLLDLSRLDAGSLQIQPDDVDLAELARSVAGEFAPAVSQHHTELELRLPDGGLAARCDRERVVQIMRILLDNALTHTPEGTRVTVTAHRRNGAAQLTVADTGPGVIGVDGQVFERFWTGDAGRGSGLGLAIAQELAERMRGHISLSSQPGRTVFTLELPVEPGTTAT
jgi:signal transduction histidine kinase